MSVVAFEDGDITLLAPPKYTRDRAAQLYPDAFGRGIEFSALQRIPGDVIEFGSYNGYTARVLAEQMTRFDHQGKLWLFDSFAGMPDTRSDVDINSYELKRGAWLPGTCRSLPGASERIAAALERLLPGRVVIVPGWFEETVQHLPTEPPSIVHIDCDLYESTSTVLDALYEQRLYQQGMVVYFDDFNNGRASNKFGERRAVMESVFWSAHLEPWFPYGWGGQAFIFQDEG